MNQVDFTKKLHNVLEMCKMLAQEKNNDYAEKEDALANFREFGSYGVAVRLSDKIRRLINFVKGGQLKVKDESIIDTCMDIINYAAIYIIMKEEENDNGYGNTCAFCMKDGHHMSECPRLKERKDDNKRP